MSDIFYGVNMKMTMLSKIESVLRKNNKTPGITAAQVARLTGTSRENAVKRISDLRTQYDVRIFSNTKGNKVYYRLVA
jgi:signal recognition particle GTPase